MDLAGRTRLLLHSIDARLFGQEALIQINKKSVYPVVVQRQKLADALTNYMSMLSLARRTKVSNVSDLLNNHDEDQPEGEMRQ